MQKSALQSLIKSNAKRMHDTNSNDAVIVVMVILNMNAKFQLALTFLMSAYLVN